MRALARSLRTAEVSLVDRLTADLRPEFAEDVIFVDASDAVMGGPACKAVSCRRTGVLVGMCVAHHQSWVTAGRPDLQSWADSAAPSSRWLGQPPMCTAPSCHRGRFMATLCHVHHLRWQRAGMADRASWTATHSGPPLKRAASCALTHCLLDGEGPSGLCRSHRTRWARHGRPPVAEYVVSCESFGRDQFDLRALPMPIRVEITYAIQRRVDERRTKTGPDLLRRLLGQLPASGSTSLLDRSPETWTATSGSRPSVAASATDSSSTPSVTSPTSSKASAGMPSTRETSGCCAGSASRAGTWRFVSIASGPCGFAR